ncbi:peptidoglycan DD-metalloendopeptidase family protein [Ekhidna sp.]
MNEVVIYLLKVIAIHGLLYVFYRLVLKNSGRHVFNRFYLLGALLIAFFIPLIEISLPNQSYQSDTSVIMWLAEPAYDMNIELVPVEQKTTSTYWFLIPLGIGLISVIFISRSIIYLALLARLKKRSEYINKHWFRLFKISQDRPFSFFSNVFMPRTLFGSDSFDQILAHECEHVRQRHSIDRLLTDFVVSLFWFNPFIYLYRNELIEIHEYQADELVLDRFNDPVGYQEILFSQLQSAQYSGLVSHFNFSMIKKRIVMMNKQRKMSGWVYLLTAPVMLMVVFAFSSKEAMKPINEVGDEIAAMIGPENGIDWPGLSISDILSTQTIIRHESSQDDNVPSISPIRNEDLNRMASGFGMRTHPIYKVKKMHLGMDFSCPTGSEVRATADGKVAKISSNPKGYGNLVVIAHGDDYQTKYAQLSEFKVKEGDEVKKGDLIALSGNSGMSTAPHLHYEVLKDGKHVDPANFIKDYDLIPKSAKASGTAQVEIDKAEYERQLAEQERKIAEKQQMLVMREKELAMKEMELANSSAQDAIEKQKLDEERKEIETRILNEKLKFEDQNQNPTIRFNDNMRPLFVIDGRVVEEIEDLDPSNIEQIEVLKGKSAKDKYGKDGNDGVIEITTKNKNKNKQKSKNKGKGKAKNKQKDKAKIKSAYHREVLIETQKSILLNRAILLKRTA